MLDQATVGTLFGLYREGRFELLARRARELLAEHPQAVVLHSLLGAAAAETGDHDAAAAAYRAAVALRPGLAKAHNGLGAAELKRGRPEAARAALERALALDPSLAAAHFNLGLVHEQERHWAAAVQHYEAALQRDPSHRAAWTALGTVRWEAGRPEGVAECYRRALAIDPAYRPAHRNLLHFLEKSNQAARLREAWQQARAALGEADPLVGLYAGVLADLDGEGEQARRALEGLAFTDATPADRHDERQRLALLVRLCDRQGDAAAAFEHAASANALSGRIAAEKGITKDRVLRFIANRQALMAGIEGAGWGDAAAAPAEPQPVFVIGFPRSGTTLLDTMLRAHPRVEVAEESGAVAAMVDALAGPADERLDSLPDLPAARLAALRARYFEALGEAVGPAAPAARLVDRHALNMIYTAEILRVFPAARLILMLRHPADCVLSCYLQTFDENPTTSNFLALEDAAALYAGMFELWSRCRAALAPNVVTLRYEALVTDPAAALAPVLAHIGLDWHPAMAEHPAAARARGYIATASYNQVTQPLYSRAVGRWRRYRRQLAPVLPVLEPWIRRLGYAG